LFQLGQLAPKSRADENNADMPFEINSIFVPFNGRDAKNTPSIMEQKQDKLRQKRSP